MVKIQPALLAWAGGGAWETRADFLETVALELGLGGLSRQAKQRVVKAERTPWVMHRDGPLGAGLPSSSLWGGSSSLFVALPSFPEGVALP